jgi:hypothetical protein
MDENPLLRFVFWGLDLYFTGRRRDRVMWYLRYRTGLYTYYGLKRDRIRMKLKVRIRIRIRVKGRIRIRIKVKCRIRINRTSFNYIMIGDQE